MAFTITINQNTNVLDFDTTGSVDCTIDFGTFDFSPYGNFTATADLTVIAGTSTIAMLGDNKTFTGASKTYYDLVCGGTPITIVDDNTFNDIQGSPNQTINFTIGSNNTINDFVGNSTLGNEVILQSTSSGSTFTLTKTSGIVDVTHWSIQDSVAVGGATFFAYDSVDATGNSGWTFTAEVSWITPVYTRPLLSYYNATDVNRVNNNSVYLANIINTNLVGSIVLTAFTEKTTSSFPTVGMINELEANINAIKDDIGEPDNWIDLLETWEAGVKDRFNAYDANALEYDQLLLKMLVDFYLL